MQLAAASLGSQNATPRADPSQELARPDKVDAYVGRRLRARRNEMGLSQGALGRRLGLTFSQVQKYEKGTNRIGAGRLYHLAALLGVSVQYFFEGMEGSGSAIESQEVEPTEAARLHQAFVKIADPQARQALLSLASSMAKAG